MWRDKIRRTRLTSKLIIGAAVVGLALALWIYGVPGSVAAGTSQSSQAPSAVTQSATQTNTGGQVTVQITWQGTAGNPVFGVSLDTHSVGLDSIDLQELATLRVDGGPEIRPVGWDAPKGGHHRGGTLAFPATGPDGSTLIGPQARTIELVLRNVAGVPERVFSWAL